jgi:hypothetical protein
MENAGRRHAWLALFVFLLAACIARQWLVPLPSSFWVDELVTAFVVAHPAHASFAIAPQVPASLYYWMPRISQRLFGFSEISYRLPSVLAMALALFLIGRIAARLIHPQAAWFAVFACLGLRGINYFADDARPYALGICVAAAAVLFEIRWLDRARWSDAALFVLFAALLWRIHLIYWPFYLVFALYPLMRIAGRDTRVTWGQSLAVFAVLALALIPVILQSLSLLREAGAHVIASLPGFRDFQHEIRWSLVAICGGGAWLLSRKSRGRFPAASLALIGAWWLIQPIALFVFSYATGNSVFITRYLSLAVPGSALMATAAAAISLPANRWREASLALGIGVLLVMGHWTVRSPRHDNSDWRSAALAENHFAIAPDTPVICPSPFVEARTPVWRPDYPLPGFLYAHLPFYPIRGKVYLFPFEEADGEQYAAQLSATTLSQSARFIVYGGDASVRFWQNWFMHRPELQGWQNQVQKFGDVWLAVFTRGDGARLSDRSSGSGLARRLPGGFRNHFNLYRKVIAQPLVDAVFLTGIHHTLPPDSAGSFVILGNDIGVPREDGNDSILPHPTTVVHVVDGLAVLHMTEL